MYYLERVWRHKSNICVVLMGSIGHRCGYVGIKPNHILYGKDYSSDCQELRDKKESLLKSPVGKRGILSIVAWDGDSISPEILFNVHGGVTYSGGGDYPVPLKEIIDYQPWWFGYDCGHAGDGKDLTVVSDAIRKLEERYPVNGEVRSLEYCVRECESLSDQLEELL